MSPEDLDDLKPSTPLESQVVRWTANDTWLAPLIARRVASGDPLQHALAVGDAWRLRTRCREAERSLATSFAGGPISTSVESDLEPERKWAATLSVNVVQWLERRGLAEVERTERRLRCAAADEPHALLQTLRARDELQGLLLLLQARGRGEPLRLRLRALDSLGRAVAFRCAGFITGIDDERLLRAAELEPEAWWVGARREG